MLKIAEKESEKSSRNSGESVKGPKQCHFIDLVGLALKPHIARACDYTDWRETAQKENLVSFL